jgi:hypothetical protein
MAEPSIKTVGSDGRVIIPQELCDAVQWISGTQPITAWLLLGRFGRHRLLSPEEVTSSPDLEELRTKISALESEPAPGPLVFEDDEKATVVSRLFEVDLHWSAAHGWRLTLPSVSINLWRIQKGNNHVAFLLSQRYIEIWSMDTLQAAFNIPLTDIL